MKNSAFIFSLISSFLVGIALSFFFLGIAYGGVVISIVSTIVSFLGIGAAWHTFGRANSIDKPAYENIGYRWPGGVLLWIVCIIGALLGVNIIQELNGIIYFGLGIATYGFWFLLTTMAFKLGLIPDREFAHIQFYGSDQYL